MSFENHYRQFPTDFQMTLIDVAANNVFIGILKDEAAELEKQLLGLNPMGDVHAFQLAYIQVQAEMNRLRDLINFLKQVRNEYSDLVTPSSNNATEES